MWKLEKDFRFEASHQLPHHEGKCRRLHGHSWKGTLICQGESLKKSGSEQGMLVDFSKLKEAIAPLLEKYLDHWHLNETLKMESPTSEKVAQWIFDQIKSKLPELCAVRIEETCTSACEYWPS